MASAAALAVPAAGARAEGDTLAKARAYIAKATQPGAPWTGPRTGPKAQPHKLVIYVSQDQRNGGALGVSVGGQEAAKAIGWNYRIIDGQGTVAQHTSALNEAIALKPDGIILGTIDAKEQAPVIERAVKLGIKVVGWHSAGEPGPVKDPPVITNITTNPKEVGRLAALYAVVDSNGTANAVVIGDNLYAISTVKTDAAIAAIKGVKGCAVLAFEDTPIADVAARTPQLTTTLLAKYGKKWTYTIAVNDLWFDFMAPSLQVAGVDPAVGYPRNISAGDGSVSAFERIRARHYQIGTVAEPLHLHGWMCIDELNRAFAGDQPNRFVPPPHLFIHANINRDGGEHNIYDPENGYRDIYKKIWGT
ncbi:MAG TPA: substrate-binding domain-containing protein [Stellaceae bacterium]|nr:substrate-binding domain-containing protein [Stellaceae bacterium]